MDSSSKPPLSPRERLDLIKSELENVRASTNQRKWEMLNIEIQELREEITEELQAGLKDVAILMGDLGNRLCKLEKQVEELTKALSKISDATAEAVSKIG